MKNHLSTRKITSLKHFITIEEGLYSVILQNNLCFHDIAKCFNMQILLRLYPRMRIDLSEKKKEGGPL